MVQKTKREIAKLKAAGKDKEAAELEIAVFRQAVVPQNNAYDIYDACMMDMLWAGMPLERIDELCCV